MGNTHSHHHGHESRQDSTSRCSYKRNSRTNSEHSNTSTSTSSTSSPSISRSQSTRSPSSPRKFLGRHSLSLNDSHKYREQAMQEPEIRPPIRVGYPYYEEVTMLAEKKEKKHKRHSLRGRWDRGYLNTYQGLVIEFYRWIDGDQATEKEMHTEVYDVREEYFWYLGNGSTTRWEFTGQMVWNIGRYIDTQLMCAFIWRSIYR